MKRIIICLIAICPLVPQVFGQSQVNYSAAPGFRMIDTAGGQPVANGNAVWIGMFNPTFNVAANANDPRALIANWINFGSTTTTTLAGQPGRFSKTDSKNDPTFNNQQIYLWIFATDLAAPPDTTFFSNVNEYGLYSSTDPDWSFLPNTSPPLANTRVISTSDVDQILYGGVPDATHLYLRSFDPVPEPSTIGLLGLAIPALVLALRKRRTRQ